MFSIGMAAMILGVCRKTLRRWEKRNLIAPIRTLGGHRRYSMEDLIQLGYQNKNRKDKRQVSNKIISILYSRVSSHKQKKKGDLERQQQCLEQYCKEKQINHYIHISDTASGLNTKRSGLRKLFKMIKSGKIANIIITFKDRLTRFGFEFILQYCSIFNVPIIVLKNSLGKNVQQELVDDMMSLIASFSGKLYGLRSIQSRAKRNQKLKI